MSELLLPSEVGRILGLAPSTVVFYAKAGKLPAVRTERGYHLFQKADVVKFKEQREFQQAAIAAAAVSASNA